MSKEITVFTKKIIPLDRNLSNISETVGVRPKPITNEPQQTTKEIAQALKQGKNAFMLFENTGRDNRTLMQQMSAILFANQVYTLLELAVHFPDIDITSISTDVISGKQTKWLGAPTRSR